MESLVTWIGGKGKFLDCITPLMPSGGKRYIEPFVGGGSLFLNAGEFDKYLINDICPQLMSLYEYAKRRNSPIRTQLKDINAAWKNIGQVYKRREADLIAPFMEFDNMQNRYCDFIDRVDRLMASIKYGEVFPVRYTIDSAFEMEKRFQYSRMFWRLKKAPMEDERISESVLTAMKMSVYSYFTELYNAGKSEEDLQNALFLFLLEFSSNGQFTFDKTGVFRPSYAGKGHNRHSLDNKIALLKSDDFRARLSRTKLSCADAVDFLGTVKAGAGDFIVVDPPLGKMYKTIGNHTYTQEDFMVLKSYLAGTKANWMMTVHKSSFNPDDAFYTDHHITSVGPHGEIVIITSSPFPLK